MEIMEKIPNWAKKLVKWMMVGAAIRINDPVSKQ
jgi:hypothetical protein